MKQEDPKTVLFFKHLAHIFYAIANADKKIVLQEKKKIVECVKLYWSSQVYDATSEDIIYDTLAVLIKDQVTAQEAFIIFEKFFKKNTKLYNKKIKQQLVHTSNAIALSYAGKNKSETIFLAKLEMLLEHN